MERAANNAVQMECRPQVEDFTVTFQIVSRLSHIRLVRAALRGVLSHLGVQDRESDFLALAAAEILTNSIEHGLNGEEGRDLQVCMTLRGSEVQLAIKDDAPPYSEEELRMLVEVAAELEDASDQWSMRGHGLQIVQSIVDSVDIKREHDRNCIILKKTVELEHSVLATESI